MEDIGKSKYKLSVIAFVVILITIISRPALAYYVLQGTSTSIVTTGDVDISIVETGEPHTGNINVVPGSVINKALYVQNVGGHPCWLRLKVKKSGDINNRDVIGLNINPEHWLEVYDPSENVHCYYYRTILNSGATSDCLYDQVTISSDGSETSYGGKRVSLQIQAEAIQSENNEAVVRIEKAEDAARVWPAEVEIIPRRQEEAMR